MSCARPVRPAWSEPSPQARNSTSSLSVGTIPAVTEEQQKPLAEQLDELGAQLDWVREYL
jgi:hypothetical protein